MTWGNHMTEIARQGIWTSLCGGWCYEPSNSPFCNVVHLYLWLLFFLLPIVVGILNGYASFFFYVYLGIVLVVVMAIKLIVMYLHAVFDSSEPVIVTKPKDPRKLANEQKRANARHLESRIYERYQRMFEMQRMRSREEEDEIVDSGTVRTSARRRPRRDDPERERRASAPVGGAPSSSWRLTRGDTTFVTADVHLTSSDPSQMESEVDGTVRAERGLREPRERAHTTDASVHTVVQRLVDEMHGYDEEMEESFGTDGVINLDDIEAHVYEEEEECGRSEEKEREEEEEGEEAHSHVVQEADSLPTRLQVEDDDLMVDKMMEEEEDAACTSATVGERVRSKRRKERRRDTKRKMTHPLDEGSEEDEALSSLSSSLRPEEREMKKLVECMVERNPTGVETLEMLRLMKMLHHLPSHEERLNLCEKMEAIGRESGVRIRSHSPQPRAFTYLARPSPHTPPSLPSHSSARNVQEEKGRWWTHSIEEEGTSRGAPLREELSLSHARALHRIPEDTTADKNGGRRSRASSSSSNEGTTYVPSAPSNVFFPNARGLSGESRGSIIGGVGGRASSSESGASGRDSHSVATSSTHHRNVSFNFASRLMMGRGERHGESVEGSGSRRRRIAEGHTTSIASREDDSSSLIALDQFLNMSELTERERIQLATRLELADIGSDGMPRKVSNTKKKYYYNLNILPFMSDSLKMKMDRLSLAALFDRNRTLFSVVFDILLALVVAVVSAAVLSCDIYHDMNVCFFAFVTASAHYSLMKSVQPDASSPTHGFNWQVAYSRPFYFLFLSSLLLLINHFVPNDPYLIPWNYNVYRWSSTSWASVVLCMRDLVASIILFLPIISTVGWLPQVSTLVHHLLEQVEMHIFGGTASFGALSALLQLLRSIVCVCIVTGVSLLAHVVDHWSLHAVKLALLVQLAFLHSRMSSNPHVWRCLLSSLQSSFTFFSSSPSSPSRPRSSSALLCTSSLPLRNERGEANDPEGCVPETEVTENAGEGAKRAEEEGTEEEKKREGNDSCVSSTGLPLATKKAAIARAKRDLAFSFLFLLLVFILQCTTIVSITQPYMTIVCVVLTYLVGLCNHYLYVQLRKQTPWKLIARPVLRSSEFGLFEVDHPAVLTVFEKVHVCMALLEKNILYPLCVVSSMTGAFRCRFFLTPYLLPLIGFRLLRSAMSHPQLIYVPLLISFLFSILELRLYSPFAVMAGSEWWELFPYVWYTLALIYPKWEELNLKLHFVMAYIAPWQITWGSAFHAFAQPFSIPHSILISFQALLSSIISAPLNPFLGSSFITVSYVRPVKFWERDYNTERSDASNTRLAAHIERGPMLDDSNLNGVFYEHLTRSLQTCMAADMALGRWGASVRPGDCFILASFYLNCLVHIVEVGNGFVTFQLRGLEFRGTYCHQREVEAISEDSTEGVGCCCCSPGSLPGILSLNAAWNLRWLAWEVTSAKLIIDGYSITDNSAINLLQVHELRRLLITLYTRCIIFYMTTSPRVVHILNDPTIMQAMEAVDKVPRYVDVDHTFCAANDEDYDSDLGGVSRASFCRLFSPWMQWCFSQSSLLMHASQQCGMEDVRSRLYTLCYILSLVARRSLGAASYNRHTNAAESFLYGLHSLFKGDFRVTCTRDEWVFADMHLLRSIISPSVRMALKLHQDHFTISEDLDDNKSLYQLIKRHQTQLFISHEHDPEWREAIMANTPSLLALRHMYDDGQDDYKIIMLNKMHLNMRVIKLNRECVRAFWAGQQQELVFLRNRNPERGSIQNARQVLRNMINSSADQPVGYPIYVSPLTTSFVDTHPQYPLIVANPLTLDRIRSFMQWTRDAVRAHFGMSGSSGIAATVSTSARGRVKREQPPSTKENNEDVQMEHSVVQLTAEGARVTLMKGSGSSVPPHSSPAVPSTQSTCMQPSASSSVASSTATLVDMELMDVATVTHLLLSIVNAPEEEVKSSVFVEIVNDDNIFPHLHEAMKATGEPLVTWPNPSWRLSVQKAKSDLRESMVGEQGIIVHTWYPNHPLKSLRSHIGETIHLVLLLQPGLLMCVGEKGTRPLTRTEARAAHELLEVKRSRLCGGSLPQGGLPSHRRSSPLPLRSYHRRTQSTEGSSSLRVVAPSTQRTSQETEDAATPPSSPVT